MFSFVNLFHVFLNTSVFAGALGFFFGGGHLSLGSVPVCTHLRTKYCLLIIHFRKSISVNLPSSHVSPVHPGAQMQVNPSTPIVALQVPPC